MNEDELKAAAEKLVVSFIDDMDEDDGVWSTDDLVSRIVDLVKTFAQEKS
jgi:hypothetical protein